MLPIKHIVKSKIPKRYITRGQSVLTFLISKTSTILQNKMQGNMNVIELSVVDPRNPINYILIYISTYSA
jgi:hypothetical protein